MLVRTFVCQIHEDYGSLGWAPTWMENADPYTGMAIPHDMLEHPAKCRVGVIADECMALGAAWWIRGETDWFGRTVYRSKPEENLCVEFQTVMEPYWEGHPVHGFFPSPPRCRRSSYLYKKMQEIAWMGQDFLLREFSDNDDTRLLTDQNCEYIAGWMVHGYRHARARYRTCDNYGLSVLFSRIADDADKNLKYADEGVKYKVSVNLRRLDFSSKLLYSED